MLSGILSEVNLAYIHALSWQEKKIELRHLIDKNKLHVLYSKHLGTYFMQTLTQCSLTLP